MTTSRGKIWTKLYPYQRVAAEFILDKRGAGLFGEQGTGKTWVTGGVIEALHEGHGPSLEVLLVVPLANIETTWQALLDEHLPSIGVARTWENYKRLRGSARVLLTHYEGLSKFIDRVAKRHWTLVAYDESQRLKDRNSRASRQAKRFSDVDHRLILSGTPIEQAPQDLWAQLRFACPWIFGTKWKRFEKKYLRRYGYMGYKRKFKNHKVKEFLKKVEPWVRRIEKKDVLDLPSLTFIKAPVSLYGDQRRMYEEMEHQLVTEVRGQASTAEFKMTQMIRHQQICGGFLKTDEGDELWVGDAKLRKVRAIRRRVDGPCIIFCKYTEEVRQLQREFDGVAFHGKIPKKKRPTIIRDFQAGKIQTLVCQVRTGGVGLDLQVAADAIFYSSTFSFIDFDQAVARLHRHGQNREVTIYLIYARHTIDEDIYSAIMNKQSVAKTVLTRLKEKATMADTKKKTKKTKKKVKKSDEEKPKAEAKKYGVQDLAELLEIKPASVRVRLRDHEVPKAGKSYGWNTKKELEEVAAAIYPEEEEAAEE